VLHETIEKAAGGFAGGAVAKPQAAILSCDLETLKALADRCGQFSPTVAVEESPRPDSLLLDVTGLAHLFDGEASLAERIVDDFDRHGLIVRVAVADTIGAAWATAHYPTQQATPSPSQKAARGPATIVPAGKSLAALRRLPIEALRLSERVIDLLHQLGIYLIEQLEALPRRELSSRFGPQLLLRWDQAVGRVAEPLPSYQPAPEFRADWSPSQPTTRRETIEAALEQLIVQVAAMLIHAGRGAVRLECRFDCLSDDLTKVAPQQISVGLFEPSASADHLLQLARVQLERLRLPAPVSAVQVAATSTAALVRRQREMFFCGDGNESSRRQLATLIDRLSSRLGHRSVVRTRLVSDAQPEFAWRRDLLVGKVPRRRVRRKTTAPDLPPRPLRLLQRPIALAAISIAPEGPPLRFRFYHDEHQVTHTWGPERIETGWWRGRTIGRDYYRIETTTGRRFWLFRRLRDGRWFLQGTFQ